SVLKDASAAIYGAQAGNGVILITTKRGKTGKPTVKLSLNQGISQLTRVPENAGSALYAEFVNQRAAKDGRPPFFSEGDIQKFKDGTDPFYPSTDWYAECLNKFVPLSKHNITIDGGTEDIQYLVSGSYARENGIFKEADTYFKTYSLISRLDAQINSSIKLGLDLNYRYRDNYDEGDAFSSLATALPTEPVYWPNGMPSSGIENSANPIMQTSIASGYSQTLTKLMSIKGSFDIKIPVVLGLGVDGYININQTGTGSKNWQTPWITNSYNRNTGEYSEVPTAFKDPRLTQNSSEGKSYLANIRLYYDKVFNNHQINTFIAAEQSESESGNFQAYRRYYLSTSIDELFAGGLEGMTNNGSASESGRQNIFGRVSYNFAERYLFDFNFRYDGSYRFPKEHRWGFFPGGSAAWRMSEENFIKNNYSFIDNLKLRASYGQLGNDAVSAFQFLSLYSLGQTGYNLGSPVKTYQGLVAGVTPNSQITWEVAKISNIGFDAIMWNGLFGMTLDLFKQKRSNILASRDLAIPKFIGLDLPNENIGVVENKGAELVLSTSKASTNFSYQISGNIAYQKSKIIDIDEASNIPDYQKVEGHPIGAEAYYVAMGIFRTQEQIDNSPHVPGTVLGDLIYEDYNNDGTISSGDMRVLDKTPYPEITFGTNLTMTYRQFSIWANFAGQTRAWAYFHKHSKGAGHNLLKELAENRYTPGSMDSKYPNIPDSEVLGMDISGYKSTFWLQDVSFVRLKTLQLSYIIPHNILSNLNISSAKVFINGSNLFTLDKLKWFDPEGTQSQGKFYPQTKVYNLGINLTF
ncbi:MAG: SusC/RagA family TonB-linked outer membrane protein, partial [Atribacterota bacterium]|nr:SusC/RagA family TonB-linked outer membrane protein [Atribacterota bacterium]